MRDEEQKLVYWSIESIKVDCLWVFAYQVRIELEKDITKPERLLTNLG